MWDPTVCPVIHYYDFKTSEMAYSHKMHFSFETVPGTWVEWEWPLLVQCPAFPESLPSKDFKGPWKKV